MTTKWELHRAAWIDCTRCKLCEGRRKVVLARGSIPCDVFFCGEGPGESEDTLGRPFCGPAGQLLDQIIADGFEATQVPGTSGLDYNSLRWAFSNLVACIPREETATGLRGKATEPPRYAVEACAPRLRELAEMCRPRVVVAVGALAGKWLPTLLAAEPVPAKGRLRAEYERAVKGQEPRLLGGAKLVEVTHPAAILRAPIAQQSLMIQRCVVQLANAVEGLR